ncbi:hypothetical protein M3175_20885 [Robertmurraya korlensis]|uniref:hypothetical protein n=1 Tax=Robertmurraya korlensis TaxID=519977 RepID=UPI0020409FE7|nr:hypothetical protein [Robertmurraya korlensis]MCM3603198.1 hypothetical protein [Robertmurraya korlensis]
MSVDMQKVVSRLQTDLNFAAEFLDNSVEALKSYNLLSHEYSALVSRNSNDLQKLGFEQSVVSAALSGAHSSTCPK